MNFSYINNHYKTPVFVWGAIRWRGADGKEHNFCLPVAKLYTLRSKGATHVEIIAMALNDLDGGIFQTWFALADLFPYKETNDAVNTETITLENGLKAHIPKEEPALVGRTVEIYPE